MNQIRFTNRLFYLALSTALLVVVFYQAIVAVITGNPFGFLSPAIAIALLFLMALRHAYTRMVLYLWAGVFMILASAIKIAAKYLTQTTNLPTGFDAASIFLNLVFVAIGMLAILGARRFIAPANPDPEKSTPPHR